MPNNTKGKRKRVAPQGVLESFIALSLIKAFIQVAAAKSAEPVEQKPETEDITYEDVTEQKRISE